VVMMESYLNENFGEVKPKHSSEEVLQRWRNLCSVVKNPKRRFRFTANLSKRYEAAAMRRTNQVSRFSFFLFYLLHEKTSVLIENLKLKKQNHSIFIHKLILEFQDACTSGILSCLEIMNCFRLVSL
jgi:hypothetical protein